MDCRIGCAACCTQISISSAMPGYPKGKPAGVRCQHLTPDNRCLIWGEPVYPEVCRSFSAQKVYCGETNEAAFSLLSALELATRPSAAQALKGIKDVENR